MGWGPMKSVQLAKPKKVSRKNINQIGSSTPGIVGVNIKNIGSRGIFHCQLVVFLGGEEVYVLVFFFFGGGRHGRGIGWSTPLKFNMVHLKIKPGGNGDSELGNHHFQVPCSTLRGYVKDIPTTNGQSLIFGLPKSGKLWTFRVLMLMNDYPSCLPLPLMCPIKNMLMLSWNFCGIT